MDKILELAQKINQDLKQNESVQQFNYYQKLVKKNRELTELEEKIKNTQKKIMNSVIDSEEQQQLIKEKEELDSNYHSHPLIINYNYYQALVQDLLREVENILK